MFRPRKHYASTRSQVDATSPSVSIEQARDSTGYKRPRLLQNPTICPNSTDKSPFLQSDRPKDPSQLSESLVLQDDHWSIKTLTPNTTKLVDLSRNWKQQIAPSIRFCKRIGTKWSKNEFYSILSMRSHIIVWKFFVSSDSSGNCHLKDSVFMLKYPKEHTDTLQDFHPFVLKDRNRVSLLVLCESGHIFYWKDCETLSNAPMNAEIALDRNESITTDTRQAYMTHNGATISIFCWSNLGNVWEVSVSESSVSLRSFNMNSKSVFKALTNSFSRFFSEKAIQNSIQKIYCYENDSEIDSESKLLALLDNGMLQCRLFDAIDIENCSMDMQWEFDLFRFGKVFFTEKNSSDESLERIHIPTISMHRPDSFTVMLAFVCSETSITKQLRFALFHFRIASSTSHYGFYEPIWSHSFDYSLTIDLANDAENIVNVEIVSISSESMYVVWTQMDPVHIEAVSVSQLNSVESHSVSLETQKDRASAYALLMEDGSNGIRGSLLRITIDTRPSIPMPQFSIVTAKKFDPLTRVDCPKILPKAQESEAITLDIGASVNKYVSQLEKLFFSREKYCVCVDDGDVDRVAHAAIAIHFQILNANPSAGLRWSTETGNMSPAGKEMYMLTPKLIRYQLEEKRKRVDAFVSFLQRQCHSIWDHMTRSKDLMEHFSLDRAKLNAAITLCNIQASLNVDVGTKVSGILHFAIQRTVRKRGYEDEELRSSGYNAFDIFYCEVSRILELLEALPIELERVLSNALDDFELIKVVGDANASAICLLQGFTSSSLSTIAGESMVTQKVRRDVLDLIALSSSVFLPTHMKIVQGIGGHLTLHNIVKIADQIRELGVIVLDSLPSNSSPTNCEFIMLILDPLVYVAALSRSESECVEDGNRKESQAKRLNECVKLCEKYLYFEGMIFLFTTKFAEKWMDIDAILCDSNDQRKAVEQIAIYCENSPGFSSFLYRWIAGEVINPWISPEDVDGLQREQKRRIQMLLLLTSSGDLCTPELHEFLLHDDRLKKYAWMTSISLNDFRQTASLAFHQGQMETTNVSRRKTLTSISKIAMLGANSTDSTAIQYELTRNRIQETLFQLPVPIVNLPADRPHSFQELIQACIDAVDDLEASDSLRPSVFLMCLEALDCVMEMSEEEVDAKELYANVWRWCLMTDMEKWKLINEWWENSANEIQMECEMRETLLYSVMSRYGSCGKAGALTLSAIDGIVGAEEDSAKTDRQICEIIKKTLTLAVSAGSMKD